MIDMVNVMIYKKEGYIEGFHFSGHAGFAKRGKDIVCAGISALVINLVNSVEQLTDDGFTCEADEDLGDVEFHLKDVPSERANLLMESFLLGVKGIENTYGKYISVNFREV